MERLYPSMHHAGLYLAPALAHPPLIEEPLELLWFREPRRSLFCYGASVTLILGLGLGGVGLLLTTTSVSGLWRLGVGTALCLLALTVLLKLLLSSAIQDMNCVRSRRRIEQLRSGGSADPALVVAVGSALTLCGAVVLCLATAASPGHDRGDMLWAGGALVGAGAGMGLAVAAYLGLVRVQTRREQQRRRRRGRSERDSRVFSVSGGPLSTSRTSLI